MQDTKHNLLDIDIKNSYFNDTNQDDDQNLTLAPIEKDETYRDSQLRKSKTITRPKTAGMNDANQVILNI